MSENVLSRNQRRAIAALLSCSSLTEAAQSCGLSQKTLQRYTALPEFRAELLQAETATIDEAERRLLSGQMQALGVLESIMNGAPKESDRRLAAVSWLDFALRWRELRNVEQRIAELEAAVYGKQANH